LNRGLRYVSDSIPGIRRERAGRGFRYRGRSGRSVRDPQILGRIKALAIPPAWTAVWICPDARGHLQATGRDARGRKQFIYHSRWRDIRDETKYARLTEFAKALPLLRRQTRKDLQRSGMPREKVLATIVRLLELSLIRIGNVEYARHNDSFGLTTMRDRHVDVRGSALRFRFRGKSGKWHEVDVHDRRLAKIVKGCQDLPGQELFQFLDDDGQRRGVKSDDVNGYLREICGDDFTAKDFRTWAGTVLAATALCELGPGETEAEAQRKVKLAVQAVAERLGNTAAICRKSYVHPRVFEAYLDGTLARRWGSRKSSRPREAALLRLLGQPR
jgi:DNA topoisomerase I